MWRHLLAVRGKTMWFRKKKATEVRRLTREVIAFNYKHKKVAWYSDIGLDGMVVPLYETLQMLDVTACMDVDGTFSQVSPYLPPLKRPTPEKLWRMAKDLLGAAPQKR